MYMAPMNQHKKYERNSMMSERTQCDQCEWDVTAKRGRGWFQTAWGRNYCPDCGTIIKEQRPRYEFEGYSNERV